MPLVYVLFGVRALERDFAYLSQIHFSRSQVWERLNTEERVGSRHPEVRQIGLRELLETLLQTVLRQCVDDDETLSFFFVGNSGNRKALFGNTRELMQLFFNFYV